ncbi:MAG: M20 family metallopeptidase [Clostridiales bacterium]|nr:M20 family metallopeptidase [Clostridiales bacterium]
MKDKVMDRIDELAPKFYTLSDYIFDHPELGYQEKEACRVLTQELAQAGFHVETGVGGVPTAFRSVYERGSGGPSFGLLCEYDALEGLGHACGHHMQGPALLLCAEALKDVVEDMPFRLVVYGTPAEETAPVKLDMWNQGCFRDIDLALMTHASIETATDLTSLAQVKLNVTFHGKSAHAAMYPERGRSAFDALVLTFHGVELLREHVRDDVRMHYTCTNAGGPANVVPAEASGEFVLRCRESMTYLKEVRDRFIDIVKGAALMTGVSYEIEEGPMWPNKIPAVKLNEVIMKNAAEVGAPDLAPPRERPGSTDFSAVMYHIPGCCLRIKYVDKPVTSHTPEFAAAGKSDQAHRSILLSAKALSGTCWDILHDPGLMEQIKCDYAESRKKFA